MLNLSDQELDRLSKEAAEKFEASPPPLHWEKLRQRLDVEMPQEKRDNKWVYWRFGLSGLFLLFFTVGVIVINKSGTQSNSLSSNLDSGSLKIHDQKSVEKNINLKNAKINQPGFDSRLSEKSSGNLPAANMASITANKKEITSQQSIPIPMASKASTNSLNEKKKKSGSKFESSNDPLLKSSPNVSYNVLKETKGQSGKSEFAITNNVNSELMKNDEKTGPKSLSATSDTLNTSAGKKDPIESLSIAADNANHNPVLLKRWEFSLVVGPDYSNVGFASPGKAGINIGMMVGYRINERISVQTGLLYSQKHYTAVGDAYKRIPGYNTSNSYIKMQRVDANCYMWDLPVNIRYDFLLRKKQRAFASVGISSYFMNKEDLHYHYTYYNNPSYKAWLNEENSNYWLSALNLSVGFEQQISEKFSFQAEPFIKLPVNEIGYGKVSMNSLGIFLSIKYTPAILRFKKQEKR
jgi:hypothetical protein